MATSPQSTIRTLYSGQVTDAALSPDGSTLYVTSGSWFYAINRASGNIVTRIDLTHPDYGSSLGAIDISADGRYVMVVSNASVDGLNVTGLFRWDSVEMSGTGRTDVIQGPIESEFRDVALLANGQALVSQSGEGDLLLYDFDSGSITSTGFSTTAATLSASADHDQVLVVSGSLTRSFHVYTADQGITASHPGLEAGASVPFGPQPPTAGAISASGEVVQSSLIQLFNRQLAGQQAIAAHLPLSSPNGMAFDGNGDRFFVLQGNLLVAFDTASWKPDAVYFLSGSPRDAGAGYGGILGASADGRYLTIIGSGGVSVVDLGILAPVATTGDDTIRDWSVMMGLAGDDTLGRVNAAQLMYGGEGNDTYLVDQPGDIVVEYVGEGRDKVLTSIDYTLPAFVEDLQTTSIHGARLTGNGENNAITGDIGADFLFGGGGNDEFTGGSGNDEIDGGTGRDTALFADALADVTISFEGQVVVVETRTQGTDRLSSIETLVFAGVSMAVVIPPDITPPSVVITDSIAGTATGEVVYTLAFSEIVTGLNSADFTITNGFVREISGSGKSWTVSVRPAQNLEGSMSLTLRQAAVADTSDNPNATTTAEPQLIDTRAPMLVGVSPALSAQNVATGSNIELRFSEPIMRTSGAIGLYRADDDTLIESFSMTQSPRLSISGAIVTIDPTENLDRGETYYLAGISGPLFVDSAGNPGPALEGDRVVFSTVPVDPSTMLTSNGMVVSATGKLAIIGTQGFQSVTVRDGEGTITFDPSFNAGGDIIRLPKDASSYGVRLSGSSASILDIDGGDTQAIIPLGIVGTAIVFADGVRELIYHVDSKTAYIGEQSFTSLPGHAQILAPPDGTSLPSGANFGARGQLQLAENADVGVGGNLDVIGTRENEDIHIFSGTIRFDPSFNRGGDVIMLDKVFATFSAQLVGSSVVLTSGALHLTIPVGPATTTIDFAGDERALFYDVDSGDVFLGDDIVPTTTALMIDSGMAFG